MGVTSNSFFIASQIKATCAFIDKSILQEKLHEESEQAGDKITCLLKLHKVLFFFNRTLL